MDTKHKTKDTGRKSGSAIILAVVLTSLLAIVGVIFLLSSRVDSVATSAIADNKDLNLAVDSVIAQISEVLAADVPGIDPNEYYDYPDPCFNPWLACLEPYQFGTNYYWRQVSDIYGNLYPASQGMQARVIPDYNDNFSVYSAADADGDGVGDSMWVEIPDKTSSKGKPIYAAIRIVDNSAMLNVNTGYKFDPNTSDGSDGSSQEQINLLWLSTRGSITGDLVNYRCGLADANDYEKNVIWQYGNPVGAYTPFDIADGFDLRYRYILSGYRNPARTRIEDLWTDTYKNGPEVPRTGSINDPNDWFWYANNDSLDPCNFEKYDYRHISTIHNLDRIIAPDGNKMFNINYAPDFNTTEVYNAVRMAIDSNVSDGVAAQIAANLIDYVDADSNVTVVYGDGLPRFGFETPCVYISEIAQNFIQPDANDPNDPNDPNILRSYAIELHKPYAEDPSPDPNEWQLVIYDVNTGTSSYFPFSWYGYGTGQFFVFENDEFDFIDVNLADFIAGNPSPLNGTIGVDPNVILDWPDVNGAVTYDIYFGIDQSAVSSGDVNVFRGNVSAPTTTYDPPSALDINTTYYWRIATHTTSSTIPGRVWRFTVSDVNAFPAGIVFNRNDIISLIRRIYDPCSAAYVDITVDSVRVPVADVNEPNWLEPLPGDPNDPNVKFWTHSYQRDIFPNKPIRRLWEFSPVPTVGNYNNFVDFLDPAVIQAHPANSGFTNAGEFGQLFDAPAYYYGGVGPDFVNTTVIEPQMRIDLTLSPYRNLFNYLTVFDPFDHGHTDPNNPETRIKGRININTAPWFVLAQLPWVSYHTLPDYDLARAIVARRNLYGPYKSIGELMTDANSSPDSIGYYEGQSFVPVVLMTPEDGAGDIFEQRDAIFARVSNLVTVRSDVFTAYILVRIGENGPQKCVVAIFDRSEYPAKPVKVLAIQSVPDPR